MEDSHSLHHLTSQLLGAAVGGKSRGKSSGANAMGSLSKPMTPPARHVPLQSGRKRNCAQAIDSFTRRGLAQFT